MKKKIYGIAFVLMLFLIFPMNAQAETFTGSSNWNVTFTGKDMKSSFKSTDIDETIYQMLPGDSVEITLALKNEDTKDSDWYMSNKILSSFEDSKSAAEGGAYTYVLTYVNGDGESSLIYSSESVGGENSQGGVGLHNATDSMEEYFYLDRLGAGKSGKIVLKVALDGETQGNSYQDTLAELQMTFATENVTGTTSAIPEFGSPLTSQTGLHKVQTGDNLVPIFVVSVVTLVVGVLLLLVVFIRLKRNNETIAEQSTTRLEKEENHEN